MLNPIIGKKVILFQIAPNDLDHFVELHRNDKNGYLMRFSLSKMTQEEGRNYIGLLIGTGQLAIFTALTKEGKASRRGGYVYASDITEGALNISGVMDVELMKGLGRALRRDKYTFTQDALMTLINWLFETYPSLRRIESNIVEKNRVSLLLMKRCGFVTEGILREYLKLDDKRENVVICSILRSEWENGFKKTTRDINSTVQRCSTNVLQPSGSNK